MVYMEDSQRASEVQRLVQIGIGLHLNLSEGFTDPATPPRIRERQARLLRAFERDSPRRLHRWIYDPLIRADVDASIADQWEAFENLYGREPTHVDGHQHVNLSPNVFLARALPRGTACRRTLDNYPPARSLASLPRTLKQRLISARFRTTDYFFDINDVDPREAPEALELAASASVEVMAHPGFPHEYERLMAPEWEKALQTVPLGSFSDLTGPPGTQARGRASRSSIVSS